MFGNVQAAADKRLTWQLHKRDLKMQLPVMSETWSQKPRRSLPEQPCLLPTTVSLLSSFKRIDEDIHFKFLVYSKPD